jgi:hypothetical protein
MYELLGLNLLCLLSQKRIADFHTVRRSKELFPCGNAQPTPPQELERLDPSLLQGNPFIHHPVQLEQVGGKGG